MSPPARAHTASLGCVQATEPIGFPSFGALLIPLSGDKVLLLSVKIGTVVRGRRNGHVTDVLS